MVRYIVSIRYFLTLCSVNKTLFGTYSVKKLQKTQKTRNRSGGTPHRLTCHLLQRYGARGVIADIWFPGQGEEGCGNVLDMAPITVRFVEHKPAGADVPGSKQADVDLIIMVYYIVAHHLMVRYI